MRYQSRGHHTTRLGLVGAAAGLLWLASAGAAGAATPPAPLAGVVTSLPAPASGVVTQLLGGAPVPSAPASPALPAPPALPALPVPSPPGQGPGHGSPGDPGASAHAQAPAGDDRAAVDAAVAEYLGVCVRVPQGVVPIRADIVVLNRNLIAELVGAGVPLQPLVVPCPKAVAADPSTPSAPGASSGAGSGSAGGAGSALPTSLAFTGTDTAPMVLLAVGLLALGIAFQRKARVLAAAR